MVECARRMERRERGGRSDGGGRAAAGGGSGHGTVGCRKTSSGAPQRRRIIADWHQR